MAAARLLLCLLAALPAGAVLLREAPAVAGPNLTTIHVAYASDASGFTGTLASMVSLGKRLEDPGNCVIHLIVTASDLPLAGDLVECYRRELAPTGRAVPEVRLHEAPHLTFPFPSWIGRLMVCRDQALARLYLPKILPDVDRVLYLDFDTIVKGDIGPLYRMPMEHPFGAVVQQDECARRMFTNHKDLIQFFSNPEAHTFNSGVLLMDLNRWRRDNITEALEEVIMRTQQLEDQFLLNVAFQPGSGREFHHLDEAWNLHGLGGLVHWSKEKLNSAKIMHWSVSWKPWTTKYGKPPPTAKAYQKFWEAPPKCPAAEAYLRVNW